MCSWISLSIMFVKLCIGTKDSNSFFPVTFLTILGPFYGSIQYGFLHRQCTPTALIRATHFYQPRTQMSRRTGTGWHIKSEPNILGISKTVQLYCWFSSDYLIINLFPPSLLMKNSFYLTCFSPSQVRLYVLLRH